MKHPILAALQALCITVLVISFVILSFPLLNPVHAAPGEGDVTFGNEGKVTTDFLVTGGFTFTTDQASAIAIQPDGKIVAVGVNFNRDFALARYNQDGSLDLSFGSGGKVTTDFSGHDDWALGVAIQPDGRIVVAGFASPDFGSVHSDFALARYNPDGSLDSLFGAGGKVTTDWFGDGDGISDITLQPDGKIVAVGTTLSRQSGFANIDAAIARYNSNGSLDMSFGNNGKVTTDYFGNLDHSYKVALQADGKIVASGYTVVFNGYYDFAVARYNTDGSLDSSFGSDGKVTTDFMGSWDEARGLAILPNGKVVLGGHAFNPSASNYDFALARYNTDGSLDSSFGSGGLVTTAAVGTSNSGNALAVQPDGKLVLAGGRIESQTVDFALVRYNTDGSVDPDFGNGRPVTTDFFRNRDIADAIAIQSDGKIVAAGIARTETSDDFALARYDVSGIPLPAFTLDLSSQQVTADRGTKVKVTVNIGRTGGFDGRVTVTPPDTSPIGIKTNPSDSISTTEGSLKFKLKIKQKAPTGLHLITFTGRDDSGRSITASLVLTVR